MIERDVDKSAWRARARSERAGLYVDSAGHCQALVPFLQTEVSQDLVVVIYDAMPGEVDLASLVDGHPDPASRYAVTRTPAEGYTLTVHPVGGPTEQHPYGYSQPTAHAPQVAAADIGAVLVPALAFARDGARLGRGKGYYDRFLGRLPPGVLFIGITGGYIVERLPTEPFDVAMTHLASADGIVAVGR